jgi:hypothetical protein
MYRIQFFYLFFFNPAAFLVFIHGTPQSSTATSSVVYGPTKCGRRSLASGVPGGRCRRRPSGAGSVACPSPASGRLRSKLCTSERRSSGTAIEEFQYQNFPLSFSLPSVRRIENVFFLGGDRSSWLRSDQPDFFLWN